MAEAGAIRAGRAFIELYAEDSKMIRSLERAQRKFHEWGRAVGEVGIKMAGMGAAIVGPLLAAAGVFSEMGTELKKASERTGVTVESLSELKYAAENSEVAFEGLEGALKKMSKMLVEAAHGSPQATEALAELGLSIADLAKLSPDEQFKLLADRLSEIKNPTDKAAAAMKIFGKQGTEILPMIEGGAAGIEELTKRCRDLGLVMSDEDATAADEFNVEMKDLWRVLKMVVFTVGSAVVPVLKSLVKGFTEGFVIVKKFIADHKALIVTALTVGATLLGVGAAILGLQMAFTLVGTAIGFVATAFAIVAGIIGAILSPLGLLVVGIAGAAAAFLYLTDTGKAVRKYLGDLFNGLLDDATEAFGGIKDALKAGDWALAAEIMWTFLKLEWAKGTAELKKLWYTFKAYVKEKFNEAMYGLVEILNESVSKIRQGWAVAVFAMGDIWESFTNSAADAWDTASVSIFKGINKLKEAWNHAFGDKSYSAAGENAMADAVAGAQKAGRKKAFDQNEATRAADLAKAIADAQADYQKVLAAIKATEASDQADVIAQKNKDLAGLEERITELKKQLDQKTGKAHKEAQSPNMTPPRMREAIDAMQMVGGKSAGTFNASAAFGLSGSTGQEIAKNTKETAAGVKQMVQAMVAGAMGGARAGLTF